MPMTNHFCIRFLFGCLIFTIMSVILFYCTYSIPSILTVLNTDYRRRLECMCYRHELPPLDFNLTSNLIKNQTFLCNQYATRRGPYQRIISISLYGPKENKMFQYNRSLSFLNELINDVNTIYPDNFILRIHHDDTISLSDVICPI
ncbi:unnamed protein product, partial [Rotaria sp. Silwood2]